MVESGRRASGKCPARSRERVHGRHRRPECGAQPESHSSRPWCDVERRCDRRSGAALGTNHSLPDVVFHADREARSDDQAQRSAEAAQYRRAEIGAKKVVFRSRGLADDRSDPSSR